ncbi:MAG TPA: porin, partial [Anaeromyxobacteraceae bacterium]|nr:porin [Anaeromyxobacteraceae bacterium]
MNTHPTKLLCLAASAALTLSALPAAAQEAAAPAATPAAAQSAPAPAAAPAAAAPAAPKVGVTVYGTLNANFQITQARGATNPADSVAARNAVSIDSSNVGVKAQADVVGGLSVLAQCETSGAIDGISASGICSRNSRVGVSSAYGTLFYGNWDTPFKLATGGTKADDPFQSTDVFGYQSLASSAGFNYKSAAGVSAAGGKPDASGAYPAGSVVNGFDVRAGNSVVYHSPKVLGASVRLQYSANEFAAADGKLSPALYGAGINYDWKGLSVLAAFERHDDWYGLAGINVADKVKVTTGAAAGDPLTESNPEQLKPKSAAFGATRPNTATHSSVDTAWRVGAGYQLDTPAGATTVSFIVDQLTFTQPGAVVGAVKEYKRLAWQVAAKHRYGDHELRARYNVADAGDAKLVGGAAASTDGY